MFSAGSSSLNFEGNNVNATFAKLTVISLCSVSTLAIANCDDKLNKYHRLYSEYRAGENSAPPTIAELVMSDASKSSKDVLGKLIAIEQDGIRNQQNFIARVPNDAFRERRLRAAHSNIARHEYHLCVLNGYSSGSTAASAAPAPQTNERPQGDRAQVNTPEAAQRVRETERASAEFQARANNLAAERKRRVHKTAAEANHCLRLYRQVNEAYGGFSNGCGFKVDFVFCNVRPKPGSWAAMFDCAKGPNGIGGSSAAANFFSADHTNGAEHVYWFACKSPDIPADVEYVEGRGLVGRCS
jgi:hypothetical protein